MNFMCAILLVKSILDIKPEHFGVKHKCLKIFLSPQIKIELKWKKGILD